MGQKKKRIFIDGMPLSEERMSGIGHAIEHMVRALGNNKAFTDTHEINIIAPRNRLDHFRKFKFPNVELRGIWLKLRFFNAAIRLNVLPPVDLFFGKGTYLFLNYKNMPLARSKSLTFVYDISFVRFSHVTQARTRQVFVKYMPRWIAGTTGVLTDSQHAKEEIVDYYKTDPNKITVIPLAVDHDLFNRRPQAQIDAAKKAVGISGDYVMFLSNIEPRKNVGRLIDAYQRLPKDIRDKYPLLLIGGLSWNSDEIMQKIEAARAAGCTIIKPDHFVPDQDLPALLSGATALLHPALYEGFGLPPLEAMACGTPVLVGNNSSLPEVVGDAGVYVEATDTDDILAGMTKLLSDEALRKELSAKALVRAKQFTWQKTGELLAQAIIATENK